MSTPAATPEFGNTAMGMPASPGRSLCAACATASEVAGAAQG